MYPVARYLHSWEKRSFCYEGFNTAKTNKHNQNYKEARFFFVNNVKLSSTKTKNTYVELRADCRSGKIYFLNRMLITGPNRLAAKFHEMKLPCHRNLSQRPKGCLNWWETILMPKKLITNFIKLHAMDTSLSQSSMLYIPRIKEMIKKKKRKN